MSNTDPTKNRRWTRVLSKGKQFLPHIRQTQTTEIRHNLILYHKIIIVYVSNFK
jgi:hypothetical protein